MLWTLHAPGLVLAHVSTYCGLSSCGGLFSRPGPPRACARFHLLWTWPCRVDSSRAGSRTCTRFNLLWTRPCCVDLALPWTLHTRQASLVSYLHTFQLTVDLALLCGLDLAVRGLSRLVLAHASTYCGLDLCCGLFTRQVSYSHTFQLTVDSLPVVDSSHGPGPPVLAHASTYCGLSSCGGLLFTARVPPALAHASTCCGLFTPPVSRVLKTPRIVRHH